MRGGFNILAAAVTAAMMGCGAARAQVCPESPAYTELGVSLPRTAQAVYAGRMVTVVAIGSSSTSGSGASDITAAYPAQLEARLAEEFPRSRVRVINRGVGGETADQMDARLERDVLAEKPELVILQAGTNTILRRQDVDAAAEIIERMVGRIRAMGADVVLMDSQYAPAVNEAPGLPAMTARLKGIARNQGVGLFRRYALMEAWERKDGIPMPVFVTPDRLHMNDWGYACVAKVLRQSIVNAVAPPTLVNLWP